MKKYTRTIFALILAVVSALALPINAGATVYSGSLGSNAYTCTVSCDYLKNSSKMSCSSYADLKANTTVYLNYGTTPYTEVQTTKTVNNARSINHSYSVVQLLADHPLLPSGCTFHHSEYYDYINNTIVLNGVVEYS